MKPRADRYRLSHPTVTDTLLIVEVSHSTLRYDSNIKVPLYARHGVPAAVITRSGT
ncbi:MAG: Uma2 family endonuclease [Gammaproteobacteria bacterium]|nr:Uma2 family endonuclease [Gammaproteobacteria bacterium]